MHKWQITALAAAVALAGCAGGSIGLRAGNPSSMRTGAPPPGSSYSYARIQAKASPNAYFGAVFLGASILGMQGDQRRWDDSASWRQPPDLVEVRAIAERDCSQPLGQVEGNLRCR